MHVFTIVDGSGILKFDLAPRPAIQQFRARAAVRRKVRAVLESEHAVRVPAPATA
jgi:hypothetical protein